jgi:competence protein ComEA
VVHVVGAVLAPGVVRLGSEARVVDAIVAAGGLAPGADTARVNLAAPLLDGSRIVVPAVGQEVPVEVPTSVAAGAGSQGAPGGAPGGVAPIDLNTATVEQLDSLPGVGPATAEAILSHRESNGPFTSVEQLLDVRGIGEAKLESLRDLVVVR